MPCRDFGASAGYLEVPLHRPRLASGPSV